VEFINLTFRLGVVLAIFSFIWGFIKFGITLLRGGMPMSYPFSVALKAIQYFLIVAVSVIFCSEDLNASTYTIVVTGLILAMYFIGKVQNMQFRRMLVQFQGMRVQNTTKPNMPLEFGIVGLAMLLFVYMVMHPEYAVNNVTKWFYDNIIDIETTAIIGFIFKIVGFFFTITILMRMVNALTFILSGRAFEKNRNQGPDKPEDPFKFDDFEEIKD
jgi:hypothetical protein